MRMYDQWGLLNLVIQGETDEVERILQAIMKPDMGGSLRVNRANVADNIGRTLLMHAVFHNHRAMVKLLIRYGADIDAVDNAGITALMKAAYWGHVECVQWLLDGPCPEEKIKGSSGDTVWYVPLAPGANPNMRDKDGWTALDWAKDRGHNEVIHILENAMAK